MAPGLSFFFIVLIESLLVVADDEVGEGINGGFEELEELGSLVPQVFNYRIRRHRQTILYLLFYETFYTRVQFFRFIAFCYLKDISMFFVTPIMGFLDVYYLYPYF